MSRKVTILVANPRVAEDREDLARAVAALLEKQPAARLTWLQSSASYATDADSGAMADEHVLTCVVEWDAEDEPRTKIAARTGVSMRRKR